MKRAFAAAALLSCGIAHAPAQAQMQVQEQAPITLTSDTPEYCAQLGRQVAERHSAMPEVIRLLDEGHELCEQGEVRHGIRQLRRALVMLHRKRERSASAPPDAAP